MTAAPFAWLSAPEVTRLIAALGYPSVDVRFVGGCLRDSLAGRAIGDLDLATPELPDAVMARLDRAGLKAIPTGLAHGTVTAVVGPRRFEITTLRRDTSCDGRHAAVEFTKDWAEDARRRDFTINAMSLTPNGAVTDFFAGQQDLAEGRVRFVGAPADRIQEDYLRILRLFRFQAHFGRVPIDAATLQACADLKDGLQRLSLERITQEFVKLLSAADPAPSLSAMHSCGVLGAALPGADAAAIVPLVAMEKRHAIAPSWRRRLAALGGATSLRLSHHDVQYIAQIGAPAVDVAAALYREGPEVVRDRALLSHEESAVVRAVAYVRQPMPLSGEDLIAAGFTPGPALGAALRAAEDVWIKSAFTATRPELLARAASKKPTAPEG